jgi:tetratricopeptide (TPR) repeat protein
MDALKKAELAKRQGNSTEADPSGLPGLSLEPVVEATPTRLNLDISSFAVDTARSDETVRLEPNLSDLESSAPKVPYSTAPVHNPRDDDVAAARPNASTIEELGKVKTVAERESQQKQAKTAAVSEDRKRAENLFQAKQTEPKANGKRAFAIVLGATTLLSLIAIGGYFWWQLQPRAGLNPVAQGIARLQNPPSPPPSTAPIQPPLAVPATAQTTDITPSSATSSTDATAATNAQPTGQKLNQASIRGAKPERYDTEEDEDRPVRITKTPLRTNPSLTKAFEAASRGDSKTAQRAYAGVLAAEPQNSDAIQGMAILALREGRLADAERYFQQALVANPQEPNAIAGLANVYARTNPVQAESRLRALAVAQPEHAAAHIALGNLLLSQQRWQEAQQSYFTAYTTQPENPDLLFNLAISLEHINQPRLAAQYYREALSAAKRGSATFNPAQAEERLRALQP